MDKLPYLVGDVTIKSNLEIEEVGNVISKEILGGLKFGGKEKRIYDEVPALFISSPLLGLSVVLQGYKGFGETEGYVLSILPNDNICDVEREEFKLDYYLTMLLKSVLKNHDEIEVLDVDINRC
ncbi:MULTISPECIES: hypothetical protein [Brevibacillus]|jgi:hypothetical protein|uniref:Uncharacterized protein n=1 Tax=Brevibacillus parabrevis TaxID=54914 RepID=A0A4Y3PD64_BREPA|nr:MULTISPECIES: hypothetical protein [Brevibacillus]MBU8712715.1 hypothetical protein [Brevibacillus parabrevis]MDH6348217.1 hypothetical protein [Brevibacillus sp. 1238]MED1722146.1 hypothetical protein [Brevibacillus parabrevis]RNB96579.1 hypothetical protein EDM60_04420 [Brevibacillus parabrevis]UED70300.1 hypothetical protein HP435_06630 [Brevibacillus sp. HD3.3A]